MEKIPTQRLNRFLSIFEEANKDLAEQEWWNEKNDKIGVPLDTIKEIMKYLSDNYQELVR